MVTAIGFDGTLVIAGGSVFAATTLLIHRDCRTGTSIYRTGRGSMIRAHLADGGLIDVDLNG